LINKDNCRAYLNLVIVYVVWGSTYLAIRVGVKPGSGFPPFALGYLRMFAGSAILLLLAKIQKKKFSASKRELSLVFLSGFFIWTGGNGLVMLGEREVNSGLASLLLGTLPLWMLVIESIVDRKMPTIKSFTSLLTGLVGITLLVYPTLKQGGSTGISSILALLFAPMVWGLGSIIFARNKISLSAGVSAAYQMLAGGIGFLFFSKIMNEPTPHPIPEAWIAWGYLVIFGSVIAYTAYVSVLKQLPMKIVTTYAYVNPVIAVLLGWLLLDEKITIYLVAGSLLIVMGVAGVFKERYNED
jgi:drug/metabolite transporter (DMT)-like permease